MPRPLKRLIYFMLLMAKTPLEGAWKSLSSVSIRCIKHEIFWIMLHENVASIINEKQKLFEQTWEPLANHVYIPISSTPG